VFGSMVRVTNGNLRLQLVLENDSLPYAFTVVKEQTQLRGITWTYVEDMIQ